MVIYELHNWLYRATSAVEIKSENKLSELNLARPKVKSKYAIQTFTTYSQEVKGNSVSVNDTSKSGKISPLAKRRYKHIFSNKTKINNGSIFCAYK